MNKEVKNFLLTNLNPLNTWMSLKYFTKKLYQKKMRAPFFTPAYYPQNIRKQLTLILNQEKSSDKNIQTDHDVKSPIDYKDKRIWLVNDWYEINSTELWHEQFEDPEIISALHRWNWLLYDLSKKSCDLNFNDGVKLIRKWISHMGYTPGGIADESYNISERISNGILFFLLTKEKRKVAFTLPKDIKKIFFLMAYKLSGKIEYCGTLTGNHVINNARALYLFGEFFKRKVYVDIAEEIFLTELPNLITKKGFLREGSSHYQLLFTRWLFEILSVSKMHGNKKISKLILEYYEKMNSCCEFFYVSNSDNGLITIPLIGDVSPDCSPEWLYNSKIDNNLEEYRWKNLWFKNSFHSKKTHVSLSEKEFDFNYDKESGWYKFVNKKAKLFLHVDPEINSSYGKHSHNDSLSFVLFINDEPIIIDTGRLNYIKNDELSKFGCMAQGHNSLAIDGLEPILHLDRNRYPDYYKEIEISTEWSKNNKELSFCVSHNGFERNFFDKIHHKRKFILSTNSLTIKDKFIGGKKHNIEWFFHFAPNIQILTKNNSIVLGKSLENQFSFTKSNNLVNHSNHNIYRGERYPHVRGWCVEAYGRLLKTNTLVYRSELQLPLETSYKINWSS